MWFPIFGVKYRQKQLFKDKNRGSFMNDYWFSKLIFQN